MQDMKIYNHRDNIYDAVDSVVSSGVAAIEGTKTTAVELANRVIECLKPYGEISPVIGYLNVPNAGYLYYVFDSNKSPNTREELKEIVFKIDSNNV